jgi:hypothetical protein
MQGATTPLFKGFFPMTARHHRKVEIQKKKARRAIPRKKVTRIQGNTPAARKRLKKLAGKARTAKAKASA